MIVRSVITAQIGVVSLMNCIDKWMLFVKKKYIAAAIVNIAVTNL